MDLKTLASAVLEIAEERGISQNKIMEVIEEAIASAYKKEYGRKKQKIKAKLDSKSGKLEFWQLKEVITPDMLLSEEEIEAMKQKREGGENIEKEEDKVRFNPERHILLEEAKQIAPGIEVGQELEMPVESQDDFGRIAAQTAKQVILQKIKELEKEEIFKEFKEKEGEIVSGIVQRVEPNVVFLDIGRTAGILPKKEQVPGEFYKPGQRLKLFVLETEQSAKGPQVILSRAYPKLISKLFELEVPEIGAQQVEIKAIAREAGSRSKVAVAALEEGIDPIGALVGQRGTRIMAVTNELGGEKVDVIEWHEKPERFIAFALSPAKVLEIKVAPKNKAQAIIQDEQLSLAIGKDGQNVRLAAKLTGWKIDIKSASQEEYERKTSASELAQSPKDIGAGRPAEEETPVETEKKEAKPKSKEKKPKKEKKATKKE